MNDEIKKITGDYAKDLSSFLDDFISLIYTVKQCSPVLFRQEFRRNLDKSVKGAASQLDDFKEQIPKTDVSEMDKAGLTGDQLEIKLESFNVSLYQFNKQGGVAILERVLGIGGIVLKSLSGAIPVVGSLAQELVDVILQELKKRLKFW